VDTNKKLLIVEDDATTRRLLQKVLEQAGFDVTATNDGPDAINWLQQHGLPHLVLLDLGLPSMHGFALGERIKKMGDIPIIILTGDDSEEAVVYGIQNYAEDYITKPFNVTEVVVRIQRVLSRMPNFDYVRTPVIEIDENLAIDFPNQRVTVEGQIVTLTPIETGLLYILVHNRGQVISSDTLIARVWPNKEVYEDTLRVHMHRLRQKLQGSNPERSPYIVTERGTGYSFFVPEDHGV
jgi:DNA-binding response OmpR family regulator